MSSKIGSGSYSNVYLKDGFAIKKLIKDKYTDIVSVAELEILTRLKSKFVINSESIYLEDENICFKMPYASMGTILNLKNLDLMDKKKIMKQLSLGLKAMHDNCYLHLDITASNCLVFDTGFGFNVKLSDFSLSVKTSKTESGVFIPIFTATEKVTCTHRPFDNHNSYIWTDKTDIWSLGIVFFEIMSETGFNYMIPDNECHFDNGVINWNKTVYPFLLKNFGVGNSKLNNFIKLHTSRFLTEEIEEIKFLNLLHSMLNQIPQLRYSINEVLEEFSQVNERDVVEFNNSILTPFEVNESHVRDINEIMKICRIYFKNCHCKLMFMAIDHYLDYCSKKEPKPKTYLCCVFNSFRVLYSACDLDFEFFSNVYSETWNLEFEILETVNFFVSHKGASFENSEEIFNTYLLNLSVENLNAYINRNKNYERETVLTIDYLFRNEKLDFISGLKKLIHLAKNYFYFFHLQILTSAIQMYIKEFNRYCNELFFVETCLGYSAYELEEMEDENLTDDEISISKKNKLLQMNNNNNFFLNLLNHFIDIKYELDDKIYFNSEFPLQIYDFYENYILRMINENLTPEYFESLNIAEIINPNQANDLDNEEYKKIKILDFFKMKR